MKKKLIIYCPKCNSCSLNSSMEGYLYIVDKLLRAHQINAEVYYCHSGDTLLLHYWRMLKKILAEDAIILCISQEFILPFFPKKQIVFFHDLIQLQHPRKRIVYLYYKYYVTLFARYVLDNITTAKSTQKKLNELNIKSKVIYRLHDQDDYKLNFSSEKKYYAVFVGTNAKHKNIEMFLRAANYFNDRRFALIIPKYVRNNLNKHLGDNISIISDISRTEYNEILQQSEYFVSSSYEEGFGPVWDGLRNGCKCVLSEIDVYQELFSSVARFFKPDDFEGLIRTMEKTDFIFDQQYLKQLEEISTKLKTSETEFVKLIDERLNYLS